MNRHAAPTKLSNSVQTLIVLVCIIAVAVVAYGFYRSMRSSNNLDQHNKCMTHALETGQDTSVCK